MHKSNVITILSVVFTLLFLSRSASAQQPVTYFPSDATINYSLGTAIIGYDNDSDYNAMTNGTSPTVDIVPNAALSGYVDAWNASELNMTGGLVQQGIYTEDNSTAHFGGGISFEFTGEGNSATDITGGSIESDVGIYNDATVTISGGVFGTEGGGGAEFYDYTSGPFEFIGRNISDFPLFADQYGDQYYELEGLLADGESVSGDEIVVGNGTGAGFTIINIPECGPIGLLALAGFALLGIRRRTHRV